MKLMDLDEQVDRDFERARRRAWLRRLARRLRGGPASRNVPPSFDETQRSLLAFNRLRRGIRVVDLEKVVGSVGRSGEFDGCLHAPSRERGGEMEANRPGVPSGRGPPAGEPVQVGRRLFRPGREPPCLRSPLPWPAIRGGRCHGVPACRHAASEGRAYFA